MNENALVAILAMLYISTSTGAIIPLHYSMGGLSGWDIGHNESKAYSKCGMEKSPEKDDGYCKDEHKFIKNETGQKNAENALQILAQGMAVGLPVSFIEMKFFYYPVITGKNSLSLAPPQINSIAVYIRNCAFLI